MVDRYGFERSFDAHMQPLSSFWRELLLALNRASVSPLFYGDAECHESILDEGMPDFADGMAI